MMMRLALVVGLSGCGALGPSTNYAEMPLAVGASVDKVTWYQGVEKVLHNDTGVRTGGFHAPAVVIGRPGLLRVFVSPKDTDSWFARNLAVVVTVRGRLEELQLTEFVNVWGQWLEDDLRKTANFDIPAEYVTEDVEFDVAVREVYPWTIGGAGDTDDAAWQSDNLRVQQTGPIRLHIVPVRYNNDGSNRLPDTSQAGIARIRDRLFATYPTTEVEVVVEPPMPFNGRITASSGLSTLLAQIASLRVTSNVAPSAYFYGLVNPATTFDDFCQGGCTTGLSSVPRSPSDAEQRVSVGIGFPGPGEDTLIHEVGHAHGRQHAPCGGAPSADPSFPYPNGGIVAWGYDVVKGELLNPAVHVDMMSYCDPIWVSDYTFSALADWIRAVEGGARSGVVEDWQLVSVEPDGSAELGPVFDKRGFPAGAPVDLALLDAAGAVVAVEEGYLTPFDHAGGGLVLVPPVGPEVVGATLISDDGR